MGLAPLWLPAMKQAIKAQLQRYWPDAYHAIASFRFYGRAKKRFGSFQKYFRDLLYPEGTEIRVLTGPFAGLRYLDEIVWGSITPKWMGCYEEELHEVIFTAMERKYPVMIDIGAAEGYYGAGLAAACPNSVVFTFDVDPFARHRQKKLKALNQLENLVIGKFCSHEDLTRLIQPEETLVICDIEGFEFSMLDPVRAPCLREADILVEIHHFEDRPPEKVQEEIMARFASSHEITVIPSRDRNLSTYQEKIPSLRDVKRETIERAMDETRGTSQEWLWMKRRTDA